MRQKQPSQIFNDLPDKRKQVFRLMCEGKTDSEIADAMGITQSTVRKQIENLGNDFNIGTDKDHSDERHSRREGLLEIGQQLGLVPYGFYIERLPIETICYQEILKPGSLLRIRASKQMGKTLLMTQVFEQAKKQGYKTANWNLLQLQEDEITNIDKLLRSLCITVSRSLNLNHSLADLWDETVGSKDSCTFYFEDYILSNLDYPLVLALDNVDQVFHLGSISTDLFGLLRSWYETAKTNELWEKVRFIIAYSTSNYPKLSINNSPFNVGKPIELRGFNTEQVQDLSRRYGVAVDSNTVRNLMDMVGGHPYLVRQIFEQIQANPDLTIAELLETAATNAGIYTNYLRDISDTLKQSVELAAAFKMVLESDQPVRIDDEFVFKLDSLGLVAKEGNHVTPRCNLYRLYFKERL